MSTIPAPAVGRGPVGAFLFFDDHLRISFSLPKQHNKGHSSEIHWQMF
jgi:hypothetical protein